MNDELFEKIWKILYSEEDTQEEQRDPEVRRVIQRMYKITNTPEPDYGEMWKRVHGGRKTIYKRVLQYAAVIALPFLLFSGAFFLWQEKSDSVPTAQQSERPKNAIRLTLSTGEVLNLRDIQKEEIIKDKAAEFWQDSSKLVYERKVIADTIVQYNTIEVPVAADYCLQLSDGTMVYLNSESKLKYPAVFAGNERKVYLDGEAYFEVAKDINHPFKVEVRKMEVEVLGTHFNINAYAEKKAVQTTLVEGKVRVSNGIGNVVLRPGEQALCTDKGIRVEEVNVQEFVSWKDGLFIFNRMPLEEIMVQVERWYGVKATFFNEEIKSYTFTGMIDKNLPVVETFKVIQKVVDVRFTLTGDNVVITKL